MNIIKVECLPLSIFVGYERENDARGVAFDYSAWTEQYGDGVLQLLVQRPGDADPYPVVLTAGEDGTAVWSPSATDTAAKGWVEIQLIFMVGSVVAKTAVLQALVDRSLTAGSTPPDPYETWLETLTELAEQILHTTQPPEIRDGYWYIFDPDTGEYVNSGVKAEGEDGVGITGAQLNADYTLTLNFSDGTSYTTPSIRGEQGEQGPAPTAAQISTATDAWLNANIDPETGYVLDRSLTLSNAAAPADIVGDIKESVLEIENMFSFSVDGPAIEYDNGNPLLDIILRGPATSPYDGTAVIDGVNVKVTQLNGTAGDFNAFFIAAGQINKAAGQNNFITDKFPVATGSGERIVGRSANAALELSLYKTTCAYSLEAVNAWLEENPIRVWYISPDNASATEFYYYINCTKTNSLLNIGTLQPVPTLSSGDSISFDSGTYEINGTTGEVPISSKLNAIEQGAVITVSGSMTIKFLANPSEELNKKVSKAGWNEVPPVNTTFFENLNYFNPDTAEFMQGIFVDFSGKITTGANTNSIVLPVKPNTEYILFLPENNRGVIVGNISQIFETGRTYELLFTGGYKPNGYNFTTGQNTNFIFVYFYSGNYDYEIYKNAIVLAEGSQLPTYNKPTVKKENLPQDIVTAASPLDGVNVLIFGDSITDTCTFEINEAKETTSVSWRVPSNSYYDAGGTRIFYNMWPQILKDVQPVGEVRNYARSGASYRTQARTEGEERQNVQYQIDVAINDKDNPNGVFSVDDFVPDIVIFALGTNDGTPADTYDSAMAATVFKSDGVSIDVPATLAALDESKTIASARKAFMRIKQAFPMAQIFCVLPLQRANDDATIEQLHTYLKQMAQRYGCIIIDGAFSSGITRDFNNWNALGLYLKDGLHPNEKGQNLMARMILASLKTHYLPFSSGFNT